MPIPRKKGGPEGSPFLFWKRLKENRARMVPVPDSDVRRRRTAGDSDASGTAVADDDLPAVLDHGNLALSAGQLQHLLHPVRVLDHIEIIVFRVSLTGFAGVRSTAFSENPNAGHGASFHWKIE